MAKWLVEKPYRLLSLIAVGDGPTEKPTNFVLI